MLQEAADSRREKMAAAGIPGNDQCGNALAIYREAEARVVHALREPQVGNSAWEVFFADPDGYIAIPPLGAAAFSCTEPARIQCDPPNLFDRSGDPPANITKEAAAISLKRADFQFVVRAYHPVPVQPPLPAAGHSVGHIDVHDARSFPVPSPPRRRRRLDSSEVHRQHRCSGRGPSIS